MTSLVAGLLLQDAEMGYDDHNDDRNYANENLQELEFMYNLYRNIL